MFPSVPLLSSFVQMINQHNKAFHKVMIWQEKDQYKYYTDKYHEEKHLDVHCLFPVERVWEFGDFNSWTELILETTSHLSKPPPPTHVLHFTHQLREVDGQFPRPFWEQKRLDWTQSRRFSFSSHSSLLGHLLSFVMVWISLISSFPACIPFPLSFQKSQPWILALPLTG